MLVVRLLDLLLEEVPGSIGRGIATLHLLGRQVDLDSQLYVLDSFSLLLYVR